MGENANPRSYSLAVRSLASLRVTKDRLRREAATRTISTYASGYNKRRGAVELYVRYTGTAAAVPMVTSGAGSVLLPCK